MSKLQNFFREEDGSNAIEYGLIAALIGLTIVVAATAVGDGLNSLFNRAADLLDPATTTTSS
ncbi:MAG: Flp family type IVb pilin [Planctomycetota bacterium]|jgi:pilus assembly protein Flp/PilA